MDALTLAPRVLLVLAFLVSGSLKIIGGERARTGWLRYHLPSWFLPVTGIVEVVAAVGLVVGVWLPVVTVFAVALVVATMVGAIYSHLARAHDAVGSALPAVILLVLAAAVGVGI